MAEQLPSKQQVAGSSPVSRFHPFAGARSPVGALT